MKLLIKFPTRGRPQKSVETLRKYIDLASDIANTKIIVSIDDDDTTLTESMFTIHPYVEVIRGEPLGKIGAINRDMPDTSTFDIILLASDDMIPIVKGYDQIIRSKMSEHFPDTDGVLWFNDGYAGFRLNTLVICGSKYYSRFGYLYYPEYKSLWCDNEFMDVANRLGRQIYFDYTIIKHEHPANNSLLKRDSIYDVNDKYYNSDKEIYEKRKNKEYDISILICTIPSRKDMFIDLLNSIQKLKQTSSLAIEVIYDSRFEISIGEKRNSLLDKALGTYCAFVDDDDKITEDYFKVIEESELKYDCITLNGMMYINGKKDKPFYHSLKYYKWNQDEKGYYRNPNHLNPIKTKLVKQIRFPDKNNGEDFDFSIHLLKSGILKTEYTHTKLQYLYMFVNNKPPVIKFNLNRLIKLGF
jgi:hypothetical protein